jgi:hypothetical protein
MTDADDQRRATAIREFLAAHPEVRTPEPPSNLLIQRNQNRDQLARDLAAIDARYAARRRFDIGGKPTEMTKRDLLAAIADLRDDDVITVVIAQDDAWLNDMENDTK